MTLWGTEFFKSKTGTEVRFGTTLEAAITRLIDPKNSLGFEDEFSKTTLFLVSTSMFFLSLLCIMGRSVVTLWMLLKNLQLIAHMTLLKSLMPQELFLYLRNLLDVMRLKFTKETADVA